MEKGCSVCWYSTVRALFKEIDFLFLKSPTHWTVVFDNKTAVVLGAFSRKSEVGLKFGINKSFKIITKAQISQNSAFSYRFTNITISFISKLHEISVLEPTMILLINWFSYDLVMFSAQLHYLSAKRLSVKMHTIRIRIVIITIKYGWRTLTRIENVQQIINYLRILSLFLMWLWKYTAIEIHCMEAECNSVFDIVVLVFILPDDNWRTIWESG